MTSAAGFAVWLYTLVFAFAALWFAHFALAALQRLRQQAVPLAGQDPGTAPEVIPSALPPALPPALPERLPPT